MPEEITVTPTSETTPSIGQQNHSSNFPASQLIMFAAAGLAVSFFLPWASFWMGNPSGFDLQKLGNGQLLLWAIPIFCLITIVAELTKTAQKIAALVTGALPFAAGVYWYFQLGNDLFQMLTYGAYLSLIFGAALLVLPWIKNNRQP